MSKVFITQAIMRRDRATGAFVPNFDTSHAKQYGDVHYIFGEGHVELTGEALTQYIDARLDEVGFEPEEDYVVLIGDPFISAVAAASMKERGRCRVLRWDKRYSRYSEDELVLAGDQDER